MQDELLTIDEVAQILKVCERHVFRLTRAGELPIVKHGRKFTRILRSDLDAYIARYRTKTGKKMED